MKLVEAEETGPVEGEEAVVTPPRPPHRRVSVSLLFTLTVLVGTVVTIYLVFPARHNVLLTDAIEYHRQPEQVWDLAAPSAAELHAWAIGVVGKDAPVPEAQVIGARRVTIFDRHAALVRFKLGSDEVTYLLQRARGIAPDHTERVDDDLRAIEWRHGPFACVAVGSDATSKTWRSAFKIQ